MPKYVMSYMCVGRMLQGGRNTIQDCKKWLEDFLTIRGTTHYLEVKEAAKEQGFTRRQLKEARKALGVETINDWHVNGETLNWFWRLP